MPSPALSRKPRLGVCELSQHSAPARFGHPSPTARVRGWQLPLSLQPWAGTACAGHSGDCEPTSVTFVLPRWSCFHTDLCSEGNPSRHCPLLANPSRRSFSSAVFSQNILSSAEYPGYPELCWPWMHIWAPRASPGSAGGMGPSLRLGAGSGCPGEQLRGCKQGLEPFRGWAFPWGKGS